MSANPNSVAGQGQFHDRIPPSKPIHKTGHVGQKIGHGDVSEFRAETFPPGTAPKEHSFRPNTDTELPGQALNPEMGPSMRTGALDMPGSTSKDIYDKSAFARPMEGQTNREMYGAHAGKRKRERNGLEGVGASTSDTTVEGRVRAAGADLPEGIDRGVRERMEKAEGGYEAQQRTPATAQEVASERP